MERLHYGWIPTGKTDACILNTFDMLRALRHAHTTQFGANVAFRYITCGGKIVTKLGMFFDTDYHKA